ncbi:CHAT domain-containing protein [Nocardioides agariphilus]|uniref:CHAT domain-containing protein n=1 Tax=Nocardioides agariphilus TaxID=433664 RepID=A0A930VMJ6_9ACTN|nr:CHAT domain-containing protein [Nocardioides agariphilus]MBF4770269.1 CHAT domain-containing protein [Nocardioides agariphilus]
MGDRRYQNFDLFLEQEGEGRYEARVTSSPVGDAANSSFQLPFDAVTLENLLLKLDPGRSGMRGPDDPVRQQAARDFGGPLFDAVFSGEVLSAWTRSLEKVRDEPDSGLRLRLRLKEAPAVAGLPWELLYDAKNGAFPAQSERTPLVRYLDIGQEPRPIKVDGPLHVLVVICSPTDLDELDVEAEWARIEKALAAKTKQGLVVVDRLRPPTLDALGQWLNEHRAHVIHFVGHGSFDPVSGEGCIYFQNERGSKEQVTAAELGPFVHDHDPLRMVVLNACRSALTGAADPFGGMAQGLVRQGADAVVAMQFPISDSAAVKFTGDFYAALAEGRPVDQAVTEARKLMLANFRSEWATPVLFLRAPDGTIFDGVHAGGSRGGNLLRRSTEQLTALARGHPRIAIAVVAACVAALAAAVIVPLALRDSLPTSARLEPTQLLVAAGDKPTSRHIWLADLRNPANTHRLSKGGPMEWLPVISPDGRTMIFSRSRTTGGNTYILWVAAVDGSGDEPLFGNDAPDQCRTSQGRPAWIPGTDQLVMRCVNDQDELRLVRVDVGGRILDTYTVKDRNLQVLKGVGDPTVSRDGRTIVVFAALDRGSQQGSLYTIDVTSGTSRPLKAAVGTTTYSDAVFSPAADQLAYRVDTGTDAGFEVALADIADGQLVNDRVMSGSVPGRDEDPVFSPDGSQLVYTHSPKGQENQVRQLYVVPVDASAAPEQLVVEGLPAFQSVPAWSRR